MENTQALSLTAGQRQLFEHLCERRARGLAPATLDQLCGELGLSSRGSLHKQVSALIDAGLVEPMDGKQRGVRLRALAPMATAENDDTLPLLGKIAAGRPIDALSGAERVQVPAAMRPRGEGYALTVQGDSMRDAGIQDGDVVIIEAREHARPGEIVVALIDGESATLKRLRPRGGWIELESENPEHPTQRYAPERVQVQGVVVGLMRRYV
ncbi:MAG: repressor LexA [Rhodanobacteraceae bacterium]|nr:repressor LexA [Rhodanobacteraceae bacterium]